MADIGRFRLPLAKASLSNIGIDSVVESMSRKERACKGRERNVSAKDVMGDW